MNWHCFNFSLIVWSLNRGNTTHNHWLFVAKTQKIGVMQVVASKGVIYRVCGQRLGPNFGVRPAVEKKLRVNGWGDTCMRFLPINNYSHAAVMAQILRLWSTVQIQNLKYPVKPLKYKLNWFSDKLSTAKCRDKKI